SCMRGFLDNGEPRCIAFGGVTVDEAIGREVLRVVQPAAIEASKLAQEEIVRQQDDVLEALERDRQAAVYAADRARRQYDAADLENRLVTAELERRWNMALQQVHEIEVRIQQHGAAMDQAPVGTNGDLDQLATQLEAIWTDPDTSAQLKKRIVRTLIEEVLVDVDSPKGELLLTIHWKGGVHTELRLRRRRCAGAYFIRRHYRWRPKSKWPSHRTRESMDTRESHCFAQSSSHSVLQAG